MADPPGLDFPQPGDYYMSLDTNRLKVKEYDCGTIEVHEIANLHSLGGDDAAARYTGPAILKVYSTTETPEATSISKNDEENSRTKLLHKASREADALFSTKDSESDDSADGSSSNHTDDFSLKHYILMTKVPGVTVLDAARRVSWDDFDELSQAFTNAVASIQKCGVDKGSAHCSNAIWSKQENKCYIIDFERATYKRHKFSSPDLCEWGYY